MTTLADLVTPATVANALARELSLASGLGLPVTAWQPVGAFVTLFNAQANIISDYSGTAAQFAQAGFASYAALMVDSSGNPITTWMALRALDQYNVVAFPATYASGSTPYGNSSASTYPYSPNNPLHFQHPTTGATYTSIGTGSLVPGGGTAALQADVAGSASIAGTGVTLVLLTPFPGVTLLPLTGSVVGSDAETNGALLIRCQAKLGTIDDSIAGTAPVPLPGAPSDAYYYVATSIPQGAVSASPPYAVSAVITRCNVQTDTGNGSVNVYIANASGPVGSTDVNVVQSAIDALVTPDSVTVVVASAVAVTVNPVLTVYVKTQAGLTAATVIANIEDQLATYFATVPIGGVNTTAQYVLPNSEILEQVFKANAGTVDAAFPTPTPSSTVLGANGIPVLGTSIITVSFV
jgi:hypothetical protein